jgi:hypothetical protein
MSLNFGHASNPTHANGGVKGPPIERHFYRIANRDGGEMRRGPFRIWLLLSAGWIMSWVIDLILGVLEDGFKTSDVQVMPVLMPTLYHA